MTPEAGNAPRWERKHEFGRVKKGPHESCPVAATICRDVIGRFGTLGQLRVPVVPILEAIQFVAQHWMPRVKEAMREKEEGLFLGHTKS